jgi:hypothetical protein
MELRDSPPVMSVGFDRPVFVRCLNWIHQQNIFLWVVSRRSRPSGRSDLDFSGRPKAPRQAIALELCRPKRMLDVVDILPRKTEDFNPAQFFLFIYNIN